MSGKPSVWIENTYDFLSRDRGERACKDISPEACAAVPANFLRHLAATLLTKTGDQLTKPGLILTWMLTALGAPSAAIGSLVPVREAGALLPQVIIGNALGRAPIRKFFWVTGAALQGLTILGMGWVGWNLESAAAGWSVVGLLAVFSLARGICSVTSKVLVGKSIPKQRRGRLSGLASSLAGMVAVLVGAYFTLTGKPEFTRELFGLLMLVSGAAWLLASGLMATVQEFPSELRSPSKSEGILRQFSLLRTEKAFRDFCIARALLASTVLAMPFYVMLAYDATAGKLTSLGTMMLAGSVATAISGAVWGHLADHSSRLTLILAGVAAGIIGCATALTAMLSPSSDTALIVFPVLFFLLNLAHTGIRLGRKTYLVDLATSDNRARLVAVSNTLIGVLLLISGSFGFLADAIGAGWIILVFGGLGIVGGLFALRLPEVEKA